MKKRVQWFLFCGMDIAPHSSVLSGKIFVAPVKGPGFMMGGAGAATHWDQAQSHFSLRGINGWVP